MVAPLGPVYQAGTLSGNPVCMAAGLATIGALNPHDPYERLEKMGAVLQDGLEAAARDAGARVTVNRVGSMLTLFFTDTAPVDFESAKRSDTAAFAKFFHCMLEDGIYWPPSQFEAAFLSAAHTDSDLEQIIAAAARSFERMKL
jgi:glutamate-1-semialdehyde 2,1-aminomutase